MRLPAGEEAICEVWHCAEPLESGRHGPIRYRQGETLLFGCLSLDEAAPDDARSPLQAATEAAYRAIFELLEARGYQTVLRFWNYFPAINRESHGMERYRQFNIGRQDAFLAHGRSVIDKVPAACALGSAGGGLQIAFLAARANVVGVENPRQLSAYHYPSQYGPRSPTFARAGLVSLGGRDMLFISGTASIVGHQTLHHGDVAAQTRECLHNIAAIVAEANRKATERRLPPRPPCLQGLCPPCRKSGHGPPRNAAIHRRPGVGCVPAGRRLPRRPAGRNRGLGRPCHRLRTGGYFNSGHAMSSIVA